MSCIIKFSNVNKDNRWRACRATRASRPTTSIKLTWANKPSTLAAEAKASPEPEVAALQQPATQHYHLFDPAWLSEQAYAKLGLSETLPYSDCTIILEDEEFGVDLEFNVQKAKLNKSEWFREQIAVAFRENHADRLTIKHDGIDWYQVHRVVEFLTYGNIDGLRDHHHGFFFYCVLINAASVFFRLPDLANQVISRLQRLLQTLALKGLDKYYSRARYVQGKTARVQFIDSLRSGIEFAIASGSPLLTPLTRFAAFLGNENIIRPGDLEEVDDGGAWNEDFTKELKADFAAKLRARTEAGLEWANNFGTVRAQRRVLMKRARQFQLVV